MHQTLIKIKECLESVITQVNSTVTHENAFGSTAQTWNTPGLNRVDLIEEAQSIIDLIEAEAQGVDDIGEHETQLNVYKGNLGHLKKHIVPQLEGSNAYQALPAYMLTLDGLRKALEPALNSNARAEMLRKQKELITRLRNMESRLSELEPRTTSLDEMVKGIEQAYNAADRLPTDLQSLSEARKKIANLLQEATRDQGRLLDIRKQADELDEQLNGNANHAEIVLKRCETAYSAATSVGLAAAFSERSRDLSISMWFWIGGLVLALAAGSYFGSNELESLSTLLKVPNISTSVIVLNVLLSLLSIGAPVWFAWLATKQIGQRFRLAEDYAFKASVSRAYEGFRREAARIDKDMEAQLLASALTRFDELPLRLVETASHGSPWHEFASSDIVKQAIRVVPGFTDQVKDLATNAISALTSPAPTKVASSSTTDDETDKQS